MCTWFWVWFFSCKFFALNYFQAHFEMVKKQVPRQNCLFKTLIIGLQFLRNPGSFLLLHVISPLFRRDGLSECNGFHVIKMSRSAFHVSATCLEMTMKVAGSGCDCSAALGQGRSCLSKRAQQEKLKESKNQSQEQLRSAAEGANRRCGSLEEQTLQENLNCSCFVVPMYLSISSEVSRILMES